MRRFYVLLPLIVLAFGSSAAHPADKAKVPEGFEAHAMEGAFTHKKR